MKPKLIFITSALALAAIVLGSAFLLSLVMTPGAGKSASALDNGAAGPHYAQNQFTAKSETTTPDSAPANLIGSSTTTNTIHPAELIGEAREEYIQHWIQELGDLSSNRDPVSRDKILAELQNPEKQIREAALQAAIELNDRSVVPRLQEVAELTSNAAEKVKILEAIEFINLPSLKERLANK